MSDQLRVYRQLERMMLDLDAAGNPLADQVRDWMDPLLYALSDEEQAVLDARSPAPASVLAPVIAFASPVLLPPTALVPLPHAA